MRDSREQCDGMARQMRDATYREGQLQGRYLSHVEPINRLVDELRNGNDFVPYVAPVNGGTKARLLAVLRDPGPKTQGDTGSGMLSIENDDPTAERYSTFLSAAGIKVGDLLPWNIYPWYINANPTPQQLQHGLEPLRRVLDLLGNLKVVMVHGGAAQRGWRLFAQAYPTIASRYQVIETYHPSRQALRHPDPAVRADREAKLRAAFATAADRLSQ